MSRRVVVTGLGAVTPIGNNVDDFWASVKAGKIGFDHITKFDTTDYKCHIAAELKDFNPQDFMDRKAAKRMEPFSQYAVAAAKQAIDDSGLDIEKEDPYMVGCAIGSGVGSLQAMERETQKLYEKGPNRVNPLLVPLMICNMAAGNVSIQFGLKGKSINDVTACATGTNTIGEAYRSIQYGEADVMVAGGTEGSVCPIGIAGFTALTALSTVDDPAKCSLPFDKNRSGFVMGEGAGVVILEELEHAKARGAKIYAEIRGCGNTDDAYHVTAPHPEGRGAIACMKQAIAEAGINPSDIGYINAHGTATNKGDTVETSSIKKVFGSTLPYVSSTKGATGHMMGAGGITETITCVKAIETGTVPPTINLNEVDPECAGIDFVANTAKKAEINFAMSNAFGFGGQNSSIIVGKYGK